MTLHDLMNSQRNHAARQSKVDVIKPQIAADTYDADGRKLDTAMGLLIDRQTLTKAASLCAVDAVKIEQRRQAEWDRDNDGDRYE